MAFIESISDTNDAGPQRNMRGVFAHRPAVYAALRQRAIAGPLTVSRVRGVANQPAKGAPTMAILAVDE